MLTNEMIRRIKEETGVRIGRPRVFYYVNNGVIDTERRKDNNYRDWSEDEYNRLKFAVLCSEIGVKVEDIRRAITQKDFSMIQQVMREKGRLGKLLQQMIASNI